MEIYILFNFESVVFRGTEKECDAFDKERGKKYYRCLASNPGI